MPENARQYSSFIKILDHDKSKRHQKIDDVLSQLRRQAIVPITRCHMSFACYTRLRHNPGAFSRNQLMDLLYVDHRFVSDRTVDSHVKNVRRKIVDAGGEEEWLRSIYGVGYKIDW